MLRTWPLQAAKGRKGETPWIKRNKKLQIRKGPGFDLASDEACMDLPAKPAKAKIELCEKVRRALHPFAFVTFIATVEVLICSKLLA